MLQTDPMQSIGKKSHGFFFISDIFGQHKQKIYEESYNYLSLKIEIFENIGPTLGTKLFIRIS